MSKYTFRYAESTDDKNESPDISIVFDTSYAKIYPDTWAAMEATRVCDDLSDYAEADPTDQINLYKDGELIGTYRALNFGSLNVMNAEWVTNALAYTLRVLNLTDEPDALSYVIDACKLIAEEDGDESND